MPEVEYVNYRGDKVSTRQSDEKKAAKRTPGKDEYHKGWQVAGIPPGALEEARQDHEIKQRHAASKGGEFKPFDAIHWQMNARKKPVRVKPYEVREAAELCMELAAKSGWLAVEIREMAKRIN